MDKSATEESKAALLSGAVVRFRLPTWGRQWHKPRGAKVCACAPVQQRRSGGRTSQSDARKSTQAELAGSPVHAPTEATNFTALELGARVEVLSRSHCVCTG